MPEGKSTIDFKPICRKCFAQYGYSQQIIHNPSTNEYVCKKEPRHRYKKEEDGSFSAI